MNELDKNIIQFIKRQQILSLSTCNKGVPHSCNCFYAYYPEKNWLICTSEYPTKHIQDLEENPNVSGTIYLVKKLRGIVAGIQFNGTMFEAKDENLDLAKSIYYKRFPFAKAHPAPLWIIEINKIKFTHNKLLGFGNKLVWEKTLSDNNSKNN